MNIRPIQNSSPEVSNCYADIRLPGGQLVRRVTDCAEDSFILAISRDQAMALVDLIDPEITFLRQQRADKGPLTRIAHPLDELTDIVDQIKSQHEET